MDPIRGMHLGLVVSDNADPEGRNRVQVWIPHLSSTLYDSVNKKLKNLNIKAPEDLPPEALEKLRKILPWAEYAAPLLGGSSGNFNYATGVTATTQSSTLSGTTGVIAPTLPNTTNNMNLDGTKPADTKDLSQASARIGDIAARSIGTPYHMGISSQCANWVNNVLAQSGVQGSGSDSAASFANMGTRITNINQIQPGDVVIERSAFSSSGYHAGIATTDPRSGTMIFASKATGSQPITSRSFDDSYFQNNFAYAVRLDGSKVTSDQQLNPSASGQRPIQIVSGTAAKMMAGNGATTGSAVGGFATPNAGTKVWVFFVGGDPQKPAYFAQSPNPGDVKTVAG